MVPCLLDELVFSPLPDSISLSSFNLQPLQPEDVADAVLHAIKTPQRAVIVDQVIWPKFGL